MHITAFEGVLIGALIAVGAQWWLTPLVGRRVRARERWEQHVLEFGELVTGRLWEARERWRRAWEGRDDLMRMLRDEKANMADERVRRVVAQYGSEVSEAKAEFDSLLHVRLRWLAQQIRRDQGDGTRRLMLAWDLFSLLAPMLYAAEWDPTEADEAPAMWDKQLKSFDRLRKALEAMGDDVTPLPTPIRTRARRVWRRLHTSLRQSGAEGVEQRDRAAQHDGADDRQRDHE